MDSPSTNGSTWRNASGQFVKGNPGGPGNPHAPQVARLRSAMLGAVTEDDIRQIVANLVRQAKSGNWWAVEFLFDRCLGRPVKRTEWTVGTERVPALEADGTGQRLPDHTVESAALTLALPDRAREAT